MRWATRLQRARGPQYPTVTATENIDHHLAERPLDRGRKNLVPLVGSSFQEPMARATPLFVAAAAVAPLARLMRLIRHHPYRLGQHHVEMGKRKDVLLEVVNRPECLPVCLPDHVLNLLLCLCRPRRRDLSRWRLA